MNSAIETIERSMGPAMLVTMRIGGLAIYAPVLSTTSVPMRLKVLLVFVAGIGAFMLLSAKGVPMPEVAMNPWSIVPLAAVEIGIGAFIGFLATMPMLAMQTAGMINGQQMGLGFARFYNPAVGEESDVVQQLLYFLALSTFLMMGGLEAIFLSTLRSFEYVNAGVFLEGSNTLPILMGMVLGATEIGMRVALPLLGVVFLETVAMGFVSKTVPQLNVLSLGFPLRIMIGLTVMIAGLSVIDAVAAEWIGTVLDQIHIWATTPPATVGGGV